MDEKLILDAIKSHMDQLESLTIWLLPTSIVVLFTAFSADKTVKILSTEVPRDLATLVIDSVIALYSASMLISLNRLYALLQNISDQQNVMSAITLITTHKWIFNPFSFFGSNHPLTYISIIPYAIFFVICYDSGSFLRGDFDEPKTFLEKLDFFITIITFFLGVWILASMYLLYNLMGEKLASINSSLSAEINLTIKVWAIIVIATVIFSAILNYRFLQLIKTDIKAGWNREAERRAKDINANQNIGICAKEVFQQVEEVFQQVTEANQLNENFRFHPLAKQELIDAASYYEEQYQAPRTNNFLLQVNYELTLWHFHQNSNARFPVCWEDLGRFPYSLLYRVQVYEEDKHCVWILAVAHHKSKPHILVNQK